jgi:hypothetical protein
MSLIFKQTTTRLQIEKIVMLTFETRRFFMSDVDTESYIGDLYNDDICVCLLLTQSFQHTRQAQYNEKQSYKETKTASQTSDK